MITLHSFGEPFISFKLLIKLYKGNANHLTRNRGSISLADAWKERMLYYWTHCYLRWCAVGHIVENHRDNEIETSADPDQPLTVVTTPSADPDQPLTVVTTPSADSEGHRSVDKRPLVVQWVVRSIDPTLWAHWNIFRSSQWSTTGATKTVVCYICKVAHIKV